jgi:hypothetical protein
MGRPIDPMSLARALDLSGKASERQRCFHCGESRYLYELTLEECGHYFCTEDCGADDVACHRCGTTMLHQYGTVRDVVTGYPYEGAYLECPTCRRIDT